MSDVLHEAEENIPFAQPPADLRERFEAFVQQWMKEKHGVSLSNDDPYSDQICHLTGCDVWDFWQAAYTKARSAAVKELRDLAKQTDLPYQWPAALSWAAEKLAIASPPNSQAILASSAAAVRLGSLPVNPHPCGN